MAYVRKVRTASGAVAVQVARKDHGKVVVLAHLGSAHTDAELGILLDQAQQMVLDGQAALDFEVSARAQSMADVADFRERALVAAPAKRRDLAPVVASGRTLGTSSRLLYDLLAHVYDWLGFGEVGDEVFRDLVIARIVEPTSKIDALRVLADLGPRHRPRRPSRPCRRPRHCRRTARRFHRHRPWPERLGRRDRRPRHCR